MQHIEVIVKWWKIYLGCCHEQVRMRYCSISMYILYWKEYDVPQHTCCLCLSEFNIRFLISHVLVNSFGESTRLRAFLCWALTWLLCFYFLVVLYIWPLVHYHSLSCNLKNNGKALPKSCITCHADAELQCDS